MQSHFKSLSTAVVSELQTILGNVNEHHLEAVLDVIQGAAKAGRRVCCYGVGREGLCMKGLAMRLFHLGIQGGVVGEMTCPPVGQQDLLLVSAGPGYFSTVAALSGEATSAGAVVVIFTAQDPTTVSFGSIALQVPSATLPVHGSGTAAAADGPASVLQMGSSYEAGLWLTFDILSIMLQQRLQLANTDMKNRHTNLE